MFHRVQKWVRGKDKKAPDTSGEIRGKHKRKAAKRQNQSHVANENGLARNSNEYEDEFKRHDVDGFDIVPLTIVNQENTHDNNIQNNFPENEKHSNETGIQDRKEDISSEVVSENTDIVQNTLYEQTIQMENNTQSNLSLDEKETLDIFDSIVNELEHESDKDVGNLQENIKDFEEERKNILAEIDTDSETNPLSSNEENWKITGLVRKKSLRFISKEEMYLPSPESKRRNDTQLEIPELPPTDYPVSEEDELEVEPESVQREPGSPDSNQQQNNPQQYFEVTITSFSSQPIADAVNATLPSSIVECNRHEEPENTKTSDSTNHQEDLVNAIQSKDTKSESRSDISTTPNDTKTTSNAHRRPRPRVTSFKSPSLPPKFSAKPVNDLVKKFEDYKTGDSF